MPDTFFNCNHCGTPVYVKSANCYKCGTLLPLRDIPPSRRWFHSNVLLLVSFILCLPFAIVLLFARYDAKLGKIAAVVIGALMLGLFAFGLIQNLSTSNN